MADFALELSFAPDDERALLGVWRALQEVGLPSQADNARGMVNAPHLTFAVATYLDDAVRARAQRDVAPSYRRRWTCGGPSCSVRGRG